MQPCHVAKDSTIFREGAPSEAVYVIEAGEVSITVGEGAARAEVARLYPGEIFGESGVLEGRPRAASATAVTDTSLLVTDAETFLHAFGLDDERALTLVKLLCRRLRRANERAAPQEAQAAPHLAPDTKLRLLPDHDGLVMTPVEIRHLPFTVSNRFGGETMPITSERGLVIAAHGEPDLGSPHFELVRRDGRLMVHDLGSRHGTIVNGVAINRTTLDAFAPLRPGDNHLIAGRPTSRFRFRLHLTA